MTLAPIFLDRPIAHRALHSAEKGVPENSMAAVRAAVELDYGVEIDLQPSRDTVPMVFHDYSLNRLTDETGPIAQRDAAELQTIRLNGSEETIPTLADVLREVAGRVPLLIEFKDQDGALGPNVGALERAAAELLASYDGPFAVMSFNPHSVAALAEALPTAPRGLTTCAFTPSDWPTVPAERCHELAGIPDYDRVGACFISHDVHDLHSDRVSELKANGAKVLCWTVKSPELEDSARAVAQNITFEGYLA